MRIAFSPTIFRMQSEGGISRYFYQLIRGLVNKGEDVYIGDQAIHRKYLDLILESNVSSGTNLEKRLGNFFLDPRWPFGWNPRSLAVWKPDIIHETYYSTKWFTSDMKSVKKIVTVYDLIEEKLSVQIKIDSSKTKVLNRIDHAICISKLTQEDLIKIHGFPKEKTSVINLAPFPIPDKLPIDPLYDMEGMRPFFLFIGARDGYKNFRKLVEAFSELIKEYPLYVLIAFGGGNFNREEYSLFNEFSLTNNVSHISGDDILLSKFLSLASALVYPSYMEGFGMPPLEALRMGTLVICSKVRPMSDILTEDSVVFFDPYSKSDLLAKLLNVIETPFSYERTVLGKLLADQFSWDKCVNETIQVYNQLIEQVP